MMNEYGKTEPYIPDNASPIPDPSKGGVESNESVISILNGLIETCRDGQEGFKQAAEGVESPEMKKFFYGNSQQRAEFAGDLQTLVQSLGGDPENTGTIAGALHRGWMNIKTAVTGNDEAAILNECERGEDAAKNAYKDALEAALPNHVRDTVQQQYVLVQNAHDRVKALRDAANNNNSNTVSSSR